jgi:hypothetical protein
MMTHRTLWIAHGSSHLRTFIQLMLKQIWTFDHFNSQRKIWQKNLSFSRVLHSCMESIVFTCRRHDWIQSGEIKLFEDFSILQSTLKFLNVEIRWLECNLKEKKWNNNLKKKKIVCNVLKEVKVCLKVAKNSKPLTQKRN